MGNLPNMIVADVASLLETEQQTITKELDETRKKNEMLKRKNEALKLVNGMLITQFDEKTNQLDTNVTEIEQLRRELQPSEAEQVHVERQQAEFNAFSELDTVSILYFV